MRGRPGSRMPLDARGPTGGLCMCSEGIQQELIAKAEAGDRTALGELLLLNYSQLARYVALKLPTSVQGTLSVDDILQQTFLRAFRGFRRLEQLTPRSFTAWLRRITENQLRSVLTAQHRKKRGGQFRQLRGPSAAYDSSMAELVELLSDHGRTASHVIAKREAIRALQIGIAVLPDAQRRAVRLHLVEGKSLAETADAMKRTPGAVSALVFRAKQNLRQTMGSSSKWLSTK